jgi:hypothetical protein
MSAVRVFASNAAVTFVGWANLMHKPDGPISIVIDWA